MTIIDRGCWERGCACYDSRVADETVDVVEKRTWVGLTDAEKEHLWERGGNTFLIEKVEALLKEKNT